MNSGGTYPARACKALLLGQSDILSNGFHSGIAANQIEFRKSEDSADLNGAQHLHAIQRLERALLVAQARKDQSQSERVFGAGRQFLSLLAGACASQRVAEEGAGICRIRICGEELDGFPDPSLA